MLWHTAAIRDKQHVGLVGTCANEPPTTQQRCARCNTVMLPEAHLSIQVIVFYCSCLCRMLWSNYSCIGEHVATCDLMHGQLLVHNARSFY